MFFAFVYTEAVDYKNWVTINFNFASKLCQKSTNK